MSVKNVYLKKKIEGVVYDIYPHTDATIVNFTKTVDSTPTNTTVSDELIALRQLIADTEARILGLTDEHASDTITATYDTIREIAEYLSTNGDAIAAINALKTAVGDASSGLVKDVADLETTVGDTTSGLVKDTADLKTTVGDATSGLVKKVADLETASSATGAVVVVDTVPSADEANDNSLYILIDA